MGWKHGPPLLSFTTWVPRMLPMGGAVIGFSMHVWAIFAILGSLVWSEYVLQDFLEILKHIPWKSNNIQKGVLFKMLHVKLPVYFCFLTSLFFQSSASSKAWCGFHALRLGRVLEHGGFWFSRYIYLSIFCHPQTISAIRSLPIYIISLILIHIPQYICIVIFQIDPNLQITQSTRQQSKRCNSNRKQSKPINKK